jgi:hypothetical protein
MYGLGYQEFGVIAVMLPGISLMAYIAFAPHARRCLTDFTFTLFLTTRMIPFLYGLSLAVATVMGLGLIWRAFEQSLGSGLAALFIGAPVLVFLWAVMSRLLLELLVVIFRIAENTNRIPALESAGMRGSQRAAGLSAPALAFCLQCGARREEASTFCVQCGQAYPAA